MKLAIKRSRIKINICKITPTSYVLFTMFSAPFIDLLNGIVGDSLPVGQIARTLILLFNLYLCMKHMPQRTKKWNYSLLIVAAYIVIHSIITGALSGADYIQNLNFSMKYMLFWSEAVVLITFLERGKISKRDFDAFWKFSCWFVPVSVIVAKLLRIGSRAGMYSSVNAMSFVFIVQFFISIYYTRYDKSCWIHVFLNMLAVLLLGTKSPYLYMAAIVLSLIVFYSKHRIRLILIMLIAVLVGYFTLNKYFSYVVNQFMEYQTFHLNNALASGRIWDYLFSGRNNMLLNFWGELGKKGMRPLALLSGIGRGAFPNGIEMDFFEILFSDGLVVTWALYFFILSSFQWNSSDKTEKVFMNIAIVVFVSYSSLGGHTLLEAIAATYAAILVSFKYSTLERLKR